MRSHRRSIRSAAARTFASSSRASTAMVPCPGRERTSRAAPPRRSAPRPSRRRPAAASTRPRIRHRPACAAACPRCRASGRNRAPGIAWRAAPCAARCSCQSRARSQRCASVGKRQRRPVPAREAPARRRGSSRGSTAPSAARPAGRRHVLAAVHGEVHLAGEQGVLDLLDEQPLAAGLGEHHVGEPIAGGLDLDDLGPDSAARSSRPATACACTSASWLPRVPMRSVSEARLYRRACGSASLAAVSCSAPRGENLTAFGWNSSGRLAPTPVAARCRRHLVGRRHGPSSRRRNSRFTASV